jgi:DNA topoisomerase-3
VSVLGDLLHEAFGLSSFRPHQEEACEAAFGGESSLLVMPTGSGKSLTYQLPGLARRKSPEGMPGSGRTTLVVAPLIALMNDQVAKLQELGLVAETIHSNMPVEDQRTVARAYNTGDLDYLFISPERLAQARVPEWLGRRPPALIAIDEAHCISHWGHDFRPEYRMLGKRLPLVCGGEDVPIVAVTATATPAVQNDILDKLGLAKRPHRTFVHGFRRTNLRVEVLDVAPQSRLATTVTILRDTSRLPAIVYVQKRADAEELAFHLRQAEFRAQPFHAGLPPSVKVRTQAEFSSGALEVVVATIAFGMGVDKADVRTVIHTTIPESIESYYQEIGRAGRDGHESLCALFYSTSDEKSHEWFFKQGYPETSVLREVWNALSDKPERALRIFDKVEMDEKLFQQCLDKLRTHDGAIVDGFLDHEKTVRRGDTMDWRVTYEVQRAKKRRDLEDMARFAGTQAGHREALCRMTALVDYFGDQDDPGEPCGLCDVCRAARGDTILSDVCSTRSDEENELRERVLTYLADHAGQSTGQMLTALLGSGVSRDERTFFDHVLGDLERKGLIVTKLQAFPKDGKKIEFRRAYLA